MRLVMAVAVKMSRVLAVVVVVLCVLHTGSSAAMNSKTLRANSCALEDCGGIHPSGECYCDNLCNYFQDCCEGFDFAGACPAATGSCQDMCGGFSGADCWCDSYCTMYGDCCEDYSTECAGQRTAVKARVASRKGLKAATCDTADCGNIHPSGECYCDNLCNYFQDCCEGFDFAGACPAASGSCTGMCGGFSGADCWCDSYCTMYGDCCEDYSTECAGQRMVVKARV